jgi:ADP-ribose pyrophosphatase
VETLALPDGSTLERGVVEHPGAVVLIPLVKQEGESVILMLRQYRSAVSQIILELPAGTRGWDEDWLRCAQRELREETGYRAENFIPLGEIWPAPGLSSELMKLYLATGLTPDPLPADVDEEITLYPIPLSELVAMAQDGRLQDGKSVVGILRTAVYLTN